MKLRFELDPSAFERIKAALDASSTVPAIGRTLSDVYLDTPDDALARAGAALRFRRRGSGQSTSAKWTREEVWPKRAQAAGSTIKKLRIPRLKQRLDATFNVRIDRWTWSAPVRDTIVALDLVSVWTADASDDYVELRLACRKKHVDAAMRFAVELGAMQLTSKRPRDRGKVLLAIGAA